MPATWIPDPAFDADGRAGSTVGAITTDHKTRMGCADAAVGLAIRHLDTVADLGLGAVSSCPKRISTPGWRSSASRSV